MYYYIAIHKGEQKLISSSPFLFASPAMGQIIRSTMFSFITEPGECITLSLCLAPKKLYSTDIEHMSIKFNFVPNDELQKINDKYSIQFTKSKLYLFRFNN